MKFTKLSSRFKKLISSDKKGKKINAEKLTKLIDQLESKKDIYKHKIQGEKDTGKLKLLNTRLKVVTAQLKKANKIKHKLHNGGSCCFIE